MRTIKSQDGKMIVNAEKTADIGIREWKASAVGDAWYDILTDKDCRIGKYSTEERALRVLHMLNEWLCAMLLSPHNCNWEPEQAEVYRNYACFQMPRDGEELDA